MSEVYRGFTEELDFYFIGESKWAVKEVKGTKPKELSKAFTELSKSEDNIVGLADQIEYNDKWDLWTKDVLETYLDFNYDKEVENFDITVLRKTAGAVFSFLLIAGTNRKEFELSKTLSMEMQRNSGKINNSEKLG